MSKQLRIGVADDDPLIRNMLQQMLTRAGYQPVFAVDNGRALVSQAQAHRPDVVIADINMPGLDGLDAAAAIYQDAPVPIILVSSYHDPEYIARALENHVSAYLIKPISQAELETSIALAVRRFEEFRALQDEAADLRRALNDRKVIERAKGLVMKHLHVDGAEAFRRLQKMASSKNQKLVEVASKIVDVADALHEES
jgi:AmiR/NasT family two-component response regulator